MVHFSIDVGVVDRGVTSVMFMGGGGGGDSVGRLGVARGIVLFHRTGYYKVRAGGI